MKLIFYVVKTTSRTIIGLNAYEKLDLIRIMDNLEGKEKQIEIITSKLEKIRESESGMHPTCLELSEKVEQLNSHLGTMMRLKGDFEKQNDILTESSSQQSI